MSVTIEVGGSISAIDAAEWDALDDSGNPFISHRFLSLLERSGSVGRGTGWTPAPLTARDESGLLLAAMPAYLKSHSQGEFVFDHGWANAWERAGGRYYPKLQIAVPFTPATGPRFLSRDPGHAAYLFHGVEQLCERNDLSSAHATFIAPGQVEQFEKAGWLIRADIQFHWTNRGYDTFDDFLASLASRKRKAVRKERARASETLAIRSFTGDAIRPEHWDAFWAFYIDTGSRKWGSPYLTREAFDLIGKEMADEVMLVLACDGDHPVAGALNFIGPDALYGRYWGTLVDVPFLHFEVCYYRAIEEAIGLGLGRVEAGAQGSHKLARGYEPVQTLSAHYIPHPGFREAVADFIARERRGVGADQAALEALGPFRRG